jgi:hypothetical protein
MLAERDLPRLMGHGGYLSYRIMKHCMYFAYLWLFYSMVVIVPVFYCQGNFEQDDSIVLENITLSNIFEANPSHLWAIVISAYVMCGYWVLVISSEWHLVKQTQIKCDHTNLYTIEQSSYSLMVQSRNTEGDTPMVKTLRKLLGPATRHIFMASKVLGVSRLRELLRQRSWNRFVNWCCKCRTRRNDGTLEDDILAERNNIRQSSELTNLVTQIVVDGEALGTTFRSKTQDALDTAVGHTTVRTTSAALRTFSSLFVPYRIPTYFITFTSMRTRTILAQGYQSEAYGSGSTISLMPAATPTDIIWENVTVDPGVTQSRKLLVRVVLIFIAAAFAYPIVIVQEAVRKLYIDGAQGGIGWLLQLVVLYTAPVLQIALWQIIPAVLRVISKYYELFKTHQEVARYVIHRSFLFQLLTIYVIVFGDLWPGFAAWSNGMDLFIESLVIRFRLLGLVIPPLGHYFSSMIIIGMLTDTAFSMIGPFMLIGILWDLYINKDERAWEKVGMMQYRYSSSFTFILALLNILLSFCLICPFITVIACVFWTMNTLWTKYALIYSNNRKYEIGTSFSSISFSAIATSLVFSQVSLLVVLWSMNSSKWTGDISYQVLAIALLVGMLLIYKYFLMRNFHDHPVDSVSLSLASDIDATRATTDVTASFSKEYYIQPEGHTRSRAGSTLIQQSEKSVDEYGHGLDESTRLISKK